MTNTPADGASAQVVGERAYSTALDKIAGSNPDDIVGLVAYTLYKQNVREETIQGARNISTLNNPTDYQVAFYRRAAEQVVATYAAHAIDEARAEIQRSALLDRFEASEAEIMQHVTNSTGTLRSVWTNFLGWCVTIVITLVVFLLGLLPGMEDRLEKMLIEQNAAPPAASSQTSPAPLPPEGSR